LFWRKLLYLASAILIGYSKTESLKYFIVFSVGEKRMPHDGRPIETLFWRILKTLVDEI
jgi:hypothetical protein